MSATKSMWTPAASCEKIREASGRALGRLKDFRVYRVKEPVELRPLVGKLPRVAQLSDYPFR